MPTPSDDIAPGYRVELGLSPGSFRCASPDGRLWVLKRLPDDCLYAGSLHPAIRDRLARIRELPHARVATLAGVVRGTDAPHLIWAHVDGRPLNAADVSPERFPALARDLASAVELLHARGLVHGGLTASNVILSPAGHVWLTHLSPYLWDDPAEDVRAVDELLRPLAGRLRIPFPPLLDRPPAAALRELASGGSTPLQSDVDDRPRRARPLWPAAAVAVAAIIGATAIAIRASRTTAPTAATPAGTAER